jgi:hypothetical protein
MSRMHARRRAEDGNGDPRDGPGGYPGPSETILNTRAPSPIAEPGPAASLRKVGRPGSSPRSPRAVPHPRAWHSPGALRPPLGAGLSQESPCSLRRSSTPYTVRPGIQYGCSYTGEYSYLAAPYGGSSYPTAQTRKRGTKKPGSRSGTPARKGAPLTAGRPAYHRPAPQRASLVEDLLGGQQHPQTSHALLKRHTRAYLPV